MKTRHDHTYENDTTPSRVVVERYRKASETNDSAVSLALAHYRGGQEEFQLGVEYSQGAEPLDRAVGADLLGQLGWSDQTFLNESVDRLISMLSDPDPFVLNSAAMALGHRSDPRAIPHLIKLVNHPDTQVRYGVVHGLSKHDDLVAIAGLIQLAGDVDSETRNWAVFGLGSQTDLDTPEIREALYRATGDTESVVRGEALVGLAIRHDPRAKQAILKEWEQHPFVSILSIEAAHALADPDLLPALRELRETMSFDLEESDDVWFLTQLHQAMVSCEQAANTNED